MNRQAVADEGLRRSLMAMVRGRVPPHEVDEIVQATLADAFASKGAPSEADELERWVRGIARHKVADYHRRARREVTVEPDALVTAPVSDDSAHQAADLLRWAERESNRDQTIDWLLREGDGEKLETIAREEQVPAARVRQRVARLRRHFRARWAAQLAAVIAALLLAFLVLRPRRTEAPVVPVASVTPSVAAPPVVSAAPLVSAARVFSAARPIPAIELRRVALEGCNKKAWTACIDGLDAAAKLDPAGDGADEVKSARLAAAEALKPKAIAPSAVVKKPMPKVPPSKASAMEIQAY